MITKHPSVIIACLSYFLVYALTSPGEVQAKANSALVTVPCSTIKSIEDLDQSLGSAKIVITGGCDGALNLSYLRTEASLSLVGITATEVVLESARIGGSLEINNSTIGVLKAVGIEIGNNLAIYSSKVRETESRDGNNYDDDENGCGPLNIPDRLHFTSIDFSKGKMRSGRLLGLKIQNVINFAQAIIDGPLSILLTESNKINMQGLRGQGVGINASLVNEIVIGQATLGGSLSLECTKTRETHLWLTTVDRTVSFQGTSVTLLNAYGLVAGELDLSTLQSENDLVLVLSFSEIKLLTPILRPSIEYKRLDVSGMLFDAVRTTNDKGEDQGLQCFDSFVKAGAVSDLTFPVRAAKVLANVGKFEAADKVLRHGSWLNVLRSFAGQAGSLLLVTPVLLILGAWLFLEFSTKNSRRIFANSSIANSRVERFLLSIDLFLPDLLDLGVRKKYEDKIKILGWRGTSLIFFYRLIGWACISFLFLSFTLRWSY